MFLGVKPRQAFYIVMVASVALRRISGMCRVSRHAISAFQPVTRSSSVWGSRQRALASARRTMHMSVIIFDDVLSPFKDKPPAYLHLVRNGSTEGSPANPTGHHPRHTLRLHVGTDHGHRVPRGCPPNALMARVSLSKEVAGAFPPEESTVWSTWAWLGDRTSEKAATYDMLSQALATATALGVKRLQLEVESLDLAMEVGGSRRAPELEQRQERVLELARGFEAFTVAVVKPGGSSVVAAAVGEPGPARHGEEGEGEATAEARRPAEAPVGSGGGKLEDNAEYLLRFDGGSRGNPGPSGAGAVLYKKGPTGWVEVYAQALWLGKLSCNQAEYKGFIAGLQAAKKLGVKRLRVEGDSQLVVRQVLGEYKVRSALLKPLHQEAMALKTVFKDFDISHVDRELNSRADTLANRAMDQQFSSEESLVPNR